MTSTHFAILAWTGKKRKRTPRILGKTDDPQTIFQNPPPRTTIAQWTFQKQGSTIKWTRGEDGPGERTIVLETNRKEAERIDTEIEKLLKNTASQPENTKKIRTLAALLGYPEQNSIQHLGLFLRRRREINPINQLSNNPDAFRTHTKKKPDTFEQMQQEWGPVQLVMNNTNFQMPTALKNIMEKMFDATLKELKNKQTTQEIYMRARIIQLNIENFTADTFDTLSKNSTEKKHYFSFWMQIIYIIYRKLTAQLNKTEKTTQTCLEILQTLAKKFKFTQKEAVEYFNQTAKRFDKIKPIQEHFQELARQRQKNG